MNPRATPREKGSTPAPHATLPSCSTSKHERSIPSEIGRKYEDQTVFFWMREQAVTLPWGTFRRSWRPFLFSDEGPFLINLRMPEVVSFGPRGSVSIRSRPLPPFARSP